MNSSATGVARQVTDLLDAATPAAGLGDDGLRSRLLECEQSINMLQAVQADAMVQMGARAAAADHAETADSGKHLWSGQCREMFVADEIGVLLGSTKTAAAGKYASAVHAADYPVLGEAWRAGQIDARKVALIGEQITVLDPATAAQAAAHGATAADGAGDGGRDARSMDQRRAGTMVDLLLGRAGPPRVSVALIVTVDTLAGQSDQPGWIPGVGPVTAEHARELSGTVSGDEISFRRLLTDRSTGVLTDVAQKRYRPSAALDRAVRAGDVTCRFAGCRRSADTAGTDLDHTVPWPAGPTSAALCRRHHRLKHTAGWTVTLNPTGVMTWTTPTGRKYQTQPWKYTHPPNPPERTDEPPHG